MRLIKDHFNGNGKDRNGRDGERKLQMVHQKTEDKSPILAAEDKNREYLKEDFST